MNNNPNSLVNLRKQTDFHISIHRKTSIRSQKKFTKVANSLSQHRILPTELKAFIDSVPQNEAVIEDYIQELKQKLRFVKFTFPKKLNHPLQNDQLLKRNHYAKINPKTKVKSIEKQNQAHAISLLMAGGMFRRSFDCGNQVLNMKKGETNGYLKASLHQKRVTTEKQCHRYFNDDQGQVASQREKGMGTNMRMRSNTEEVIRSTKHPARIYRYSSLKKPIANNNDIIDSSNIVHQKIKEDKPKQKPKMAMFDEVAIASNQKIGDISTIIHQKQTINFLGESCMVLQKELQPHQQNLQKLLNFFGWKAKELEDAFSACKQKKKKPVPDKLSKIFPKGFFA